MTEQDFIVNRVQDVTDGLFTIESDTESDSTCLSRVDTGDLK